MAQSKAEMKGEHTEQSPKGKGEEPLVRIRLDEARSRTRDEKALISGQSSGTG